MAGTSTTTETVLTHTVSRVQPWANCKVYGICISPFNMVPIASKETNGATAAVMDASRVHNNSIWSENSDSTSAAGTRDNVNICEKL